MRGFKPNTEPCIDAVKDSTGAWVSCTALAVCACGEHNGEPLCELHAQLAHDED